MFDFANNLVYIKNSEKGGCYGKFHVFSSWFGIVFCGFLVSSDKRTLYFTEIVEINHVLCYV
jgi:hypothetical protein